MLVDFKNMFSTEFVFLRPSRKKKKIPIRASQMGPRRIGDAYVWIGIIDL